MPRPLLPSMRQSGFSERVEAVDAVLGVELGGGPAVAAAVPGRRARVAGTARRLDVDGEGGRRMDDIVDGP